jgi:hypothetical protein
MSMDKKTINNILKTLDNAIDDMRSLIRPDQATYNELYQLRYDATVAYLR